MPTRLRQVALLAQDLDYAVGVLATALGTYVAYRDPGIVPAFGGMFNALLQVGDCFLEVVSPVDKGYANNSTSVKQMRKSKGDCGYMAILQVDDVAVTSRRLSTIGRAAMAIQTVVQGNPGEGIRGERASKYVIGHAMPKEPGTSASVLVQWHPKDFGTLMETEEAWPPHKGAEGAWLPAGNQWQRRYAGLGGRPSSVCEGGFAGLGVAVPGSEAQAAELARKWSQGLGCPLANGSSTAVQLDGAVVRFLPTGPGGREGVVAVDLYAAPGKPKAFRECELIGIRWRLVDRPGTDPSSTAPLYETLGQEPRPRL